jgi:hypothetical protein
MNRERSPGQGSAPSAEAGVEPANAEAVARSLAAIGETVVDIGAIEERAGDAVVLAGQLGFKGT